MNKSLAFEMAKKTNLGKFNYRQTPGVPYVPILVIFRRKCYIASLYGSSTTHRYNKLSTQTTGAKVTRGLRGWR